jgi:hypothetical protein
MACGPIEATPPNRNGSLEHAGKPRQSLTTA